ETSSGEPHATEISRPGPGERTRPMSFKLITRKIALRGCLLATALASCSFERGDRFLRSSDPDSVRCPDGALRCAGSLEVCRDGAWTTQEDCAKAGLVCASSLLACAECSPDETRCSGATVERCNADGTAFSEEATCDTDHGISCRDGACIDLC